ncbi:hypothetical protein QE429_001583 [Bacillus sp. SORGH_AS 510]|uniref:hypothetical protein n=1 Tax=Bacillus sp. SORGH_AS_0510 TaxID=3041771 RepID=UPI0027827A59|nr:hypothetical protein [Bacillus sp. SORGH_AS_0510]MDQ1144756.1 hypothetical protein [Bacillus sp. SORGH_AS_0510]
MKGARMMGNGDPKNQYSFDFDEQGSNEVSQQIMNSYNSGFIGEGTALANQADFNTTPSVDGEGSTES